MSRSLQKLSKKVEDYHQYKMALDYIKENAEREHLLERLEHFYSTQKHNNRFWVLMASFLLAVILSVVKIPDSFPPFLYLVLFVLSITTYMSLTEYILKRRTRKLFLIEFQDVSARELAKMLHHIGAICRTTQYHLETWCGLR